MIGYLRGKVIFSDGVELLLLTASGVGYQMRCGVHFPEQKEVSLYTAQIIKENSQELFAFTHLREKKLFELLNSVKGVGPKSAYVLIQSLGFESIVQSVRTENKKTLSSAPGIGPKAAAQICLDLSSKIQKVCIYLSGYQEGKTNLDRESLGVVPLADPIEREVGANQSELLNETIMACKELGFKEAEIEPMAMKLLASHQIDRSEQLVHLILKEI